MMELFRFSLKKFLSSDGILVYLLMALSCEISRLDTTNLFNFCYIQKFSKPFLFTSQRNILNPKLEYVTNELKEPDPAEPTPVEGLFKFEEGLFNPKLSGVATFDFTSKTLSGACAWGVSGWEYNPAINIKNNEYLVAKLSGIDDSGTKPYLILGNSDVMGEAYQASGVTKASDGFWYSVVKLSQDLVSNVNVKVGTIYLDRITLIGIQTPGSNEVSYKIEDVYISPTNPLEQ